MSGLLIGNFFAKTLGKREKTESQQSRWSELLTSKFFANTRLGTREEGKRRKGKGKMGKEKGGKEKGGKEKERKKGERERKKGARKKNNTCSQLLRWSRRLTGNFFAKTLEKRKKRGKMKKRKYLYLQPTVQIERAVDRQLLCEDARFRHVTRV